MRVRPTITLATVMLITAVAGLTIVPEHKPHLRYGIVTVDGPNCLLGTPGAVVVQRECAVHRGWSQTAYDAARIATWALAIVGGVILATSLRRRR